MADFTDNLGRSTNSGMGTDDLKSMFQSLMQGNVKMNPVPATKGDMAKMTLLEQMMSGLVKDFSSMKAQAEKYVAQAKAMQKELTAARKSQVSEQKATKKILDGKGKSTKDDRLIAKSLASLNRHATKKGSLYTYDFKNHKVLLEIAKVLAGGKGGGGGGGGAGNRGGAAAGGGGRSIIGTAREAESLSNYWREISDSILSLSGGRIGGSSDLWDDLLKNEIEFKIQAREIAYETQGITKETQGLLQANEKIGETSYLTGQAREKTEAAYLKNLRRGIRDNKVALKVSIAQLNTSRQIGDETNQLSDTFSDLHQKMGFASFETEEIGRNIRDIARQTGVTGENLVQSVKSSEQFLKLLRGSSQLTTKSAKALILLQTEFEKRGIADEMNDVGKALSSSTYFITQASQETKTFLIAAARQAGVISELLNGTLAKDPKKLAALGAGAEKMLERLAGTTIDKIDELSDERKRILSLQTQSIFGQDLYTSVQSIKALKEAGKTVKDRIDDAEKEYKLKEKILTAEQKALKLEEIRSLKTSEALTNLTEIQKILLANPDKSVAEALKQAGKSTGEIRENLSSGLSALKDRLNKAGKGDIVTKFGIDTSRIEEALKDPAALNKLAEDMSKADQALSTAQKSQLTVITEIEQWVKEIRDIMLTWSEGLLGTLLGSKLVKYIFMTSLLLGGVSKIFGGIATLVSKLLIFSDLLKKSLSFFGLFGGGGAAAGGAGAAGGAAGGAVGGIGGAVAGIGRAAIKYAGPIAIIAGLIDAAGNAFKSGENAAELFGVATEDLTYKQKEAAKAAGGLTGVLNFLTFGIFDNLFGPNGTVTGWLAKLYDSIPGLEYLLAFQNAPLKALWKTWQALWTRIKGVFSGLWEALGGIADVLIGIVTLDFEKVWTGIKSIFSGLGSALWNFVAGIPEALWEGLKSIVEDMQEAAKNLFGGVKDGIIAFKDKFFQAIEDIATYAYTSIRDSFRQALNWVISLIPGGALLPSFAVGSNNISQSGLAVLHKGEMVVPANHADTLRAEGDPFVSSAGVNTQDRLQTRGASSGSSSNPALDRISDLNSQQVFYQQRMVVLLEQISGSMNSDGSNAASTATNFVPHRPAKYFRWSTGKVGQTANKAIVNMNANI